MPVNKTRIENRSMGMDPMRRTSNNQAPSKPVPSRSAEIRRPSLEKNVPHNPENDFFERKQVNPTVVKQGIPVIKNNKLDNEVVTAKKVEDKSFKVFPDIPLDKKDNIFPEFPKMNKNNSFFDEDEFEDLSNYMEDDKKKSWF